MLHDFLYFFIGKWFKYLGRDCPAGKTSWWVDKRQWKMDDWHWLLSCATGLSILCIWISFNIRCLYLFFCELHLVYLKLSLFYTDSSCGITSMRLNRGHKPRTLGWLFRAWLIQGMCHLLARLCTNGGIYLIFHL